MSNVPRNVRVAYLGIRFAVSQLQIPEDLKHRVAIYMLVTGCNVPGADAARVIGSSKQYVSKILRQVEDRREEAAFDRLFCELEHQLFEEAP